ncbi:MAG: hypothetical protein M3P08_12035, partial [Thermoproteota archaeon]|nr:hypothetical protein [Thermoproteota archaeon]
IHSLTSIEIYSSTENILQYKRLEKPVTSNLNESSRLGLYLILMLISRVCDIKMRRVPFILAL